MGHHYVPRQYLKGFSDTAAPGMIWTYDKLERVFRHLPIRSVAQAPHYYSSEVEGQLSLQVEGPAIHVTKKLRLGRRLSDVERRTLYLYIGTMMMRVPRNRRRGNELWPAALNETLDELSATMQEGAASGALSAQLVSQRLAELQAKREYWRHNVPDEIREEMRSPWPSQEILACIAHMTWRAISAPTGEYFITSDNPACFFEGLGLSNRDSELTFPVACDTALIGSWQSMPQSPDLLPVHKAVVREVNRRIAHGAERFIYSHTDAEWIPVVADKKHPYLSSIRWE